MRHVISISIFMVLAVGMFAGNIHAQTGQSVTYEIDGMQYEGFYTAAGENAPFVLLVHDWDGLTGYEIERSRMLAELGYSVFAADLFGKGVRPEKVEDKRQHTGELYKDRKKMRALLYGALKEAEMRGANIRNAVAAGYCFGGAAVLELARAGADLKGFATFHGGLATPQDQDYSETRGELLVMHGTADSAISMEQFARLAKDLESAGVPHEMITYGGARHAFTVFDSDRYDQKADQKSWRRFINFLENTLEQ